MFLYPKYFITIIQCITIEDENILDNYTGIFWHFSHFQHVDHLYYGMKNLQGLKYVWQTTTSPYFHFSINIVEEIMMKLWCQQLL